MSGYEDLRSLGVQFGPFDGPAPPSSMSWSRFDSKWSSTVTLLARELRMLEAEAVVCELDCDPRDIRNDGLPRANARMRSPAVRITFRSTWGPLRYETAEYRDWRDNLRAIALSMEALRAVDRYGVSKRGEQYQGWKALPASTDPADAIQTDAQALALIQRTVSDIYDADDVDGPFLHDAIREAIRRTHPDRGGNEDEFRKVMRAREILGG